VTRVSGADAPLVMAVTGASGAPYAIRLLEQLLVAERKVSLIVSAHGFRLLKTESDVGDLATLRAAVGERRFDIFVKVFDDADRGAAPASGSSPTGGMVICPCSMGPLASIGAGPSRSRVARAADVALKERRPLLLVTRETPLSLIHLENMRRVTLAGAVVMPAAPGFYHRPTRVADLVDFVVARALDHLGVPNTLAPRWGGAETGG
jgi:4-hydroxy-3-polyprenylbenzoate decarboxylase